MEKLAGVINSLIDGYSVRGINITPYGINELIDIFRGEQTTTINSDVVKVLEYCGIEYKAQGIGWKII